MLPWQWVPLATNFITEIHIWCIKIGIAWILHLTTGSTPLLVDCKSPRVSKYVGTCLKIQIWILTVKKQIEWYKFFLKRRIISLMHSDGFGSIDLYNHNITDFQFFRPEHYWRDMNYPNGHLVHQNWNRIHFTFII
jgi:hypothetical protein